MLDSLFVRLIAALCAGSALIIAIAQILSHLKNYTGPIYQRYIVRIIFMVPVYSVASLLSLWMPHHSIYFDTVRDCYEAWVIYNFLSLCLAFVGGPGVVEVKMNGVSLTPSWTYGTCCLPPLPVNGHFVRLCKQGALQFVILKPILAAVTLILYSQGKYEEGNWAVDSGFLWIQIIYNVCYSVALYALLLFYVGAHDLLAPFNPLAKFVLVKAVVFLTFWQSLLVSILVGSGVFPTEKDGKQLANFLICLEMLPASIFMIFAFPHSDYKATGAASRMGMDNVRHAISIHDVVSDTVHQFAPTYHEYVLYSNEGGKRVPKKQKEKPKAFGAERQTDDGEQKYTDSDDVNLLENAEMGVHCRTMTSDQDVSDELGPSQGVIDSAMYRPRTASQQSADQSSSVEQSRGHTEEIEMVRGNVQQHFLNPPSRDFDLN